MLTKEKYEALLEEVVREFPEFRVVKKSESRLMGAIDRFLRVITLGKMDAFMTRFITTLGTTIYVTDTWDSASYATRAITLRHERVHMRQAREWGQFLFSFFYLFFLPTVWAFGRTRFEKEAYEESLRAYHEYYGSKYFTQALKDDIVRHFTSAEYFWAWPWKRSIERWYDDVVASITKV